MIRSLFVTLALIAATAAVVARSREHDPCSCRQIDVDVSCPSPCPNGGAR